MPDTPAALTRFRFRPALVDALRGYTAAAFARDAAAGLVVGIVAIPLALAFAIASGVSPGAGLATAVVAGFLISALGGSPVQIGGPTGAFVVIVFGIVGEHGLDGLAIATLMAGAILVLFGIFRLGRVIKFIPDPVIVGFTAGIGGIILVGQLKEVLGLSSLDLPADAVGKLRAIAGGIGAWNPWALAIALATVVTIVGIRKTVPRVPGPVVGLVVFTALVALLDIPVETIGDRFGELTSGLPSPALPAISLDRLRELVGPAITIALLGAVESLLSAVVGDAMAETRHDSDQELIAQGIANLASPLFGGIPATGAIARTATNIQNGGRTPVSGMLHAGVVLACIAFGAPLLASIPLAVLGGILVVVAYYMSDVPRLLTLHRMARADAAVLVATLLLTVFVDLVVAVEVGMILAAFLFMYRMSEVARVDVVHPETDVTYGGQQSIHGKSVPEGVLTYSIDGPFFFGAAERFQRTIERIAKHPPVVIFRMRHVPYMDHTGLETLTDVVKGFRKSGTTVVLSAVQAGPLILMRRSGFTPDVVEERNIQPHIDLALDRAREILAEQATSPPPS